MINAFYLGRLPKIFFGPGKIKMLSDIIASNGKNILLVTGSHGLAKEGHLSNLNFLSENKSFNLNLATVSNEPRPADINRITYENRVKDIDVVVAIGGGSVIDAGKAVSAMLPHSDSVKDYLEGVGTKKHPGQKIFFVAVPSTSGTGSEATSNAVISETGLHGFKRSLRHENFMPDVALIDPELTLSCPPGITAASGMDAFTQLLESYTSVTSGAFTDMLALEGIRALNANIETAYSHGDNIKARTAMSYAALLSGITLSYAGLGLVHGFASATGALFNIPHGIICANLMAPVNRHNVEGVMESGDKVSLGKYAAIGKILSGQDKRTDEWFAGYVPDHIENLAFRLSIKKLGIFGVKESDVEIIAKNSGNKSNPVNISDEDKIRILKSCL